MSGSTPSTSAGLRTVLKAKAKQRFSFKSKMDAAHAIANAAGHGQTAVKSKMIAAAHKQWPPKKGK